MQLLHETRARIVPPTAHIAEETRQLLDAKTKPPGSLGRLEDIACQYASMRATAQPPLPRKAIVVLAGDNGVADAAVSAYPQAVTAQMLHNFAAGGAAINVLARHAGARLLVVDMGVKEAPPAHARIRSVRIGPGTEDFTCTAAMGPEKAVRAIEAGITIAQELAADGTSLLGVGEMGIGNTTAASALVAALTRAPVAQVTGHGTGIDEAGFQRKVAAIEKGLQLHQPRQEDGVDALAKLGGFEIAGLCGVILGAAAARLPVLLDGFIASTAALCAQRIAPTARMYLLASHRSAEAGHALVLQLLGLKPLLTLDMRLGEGTGAALGMGLVDASLRILHEMATFASAGVLQG